MTSNTNKDDTYDELSMAVSDVHVMAEMLQIANDNQGMEVPGETVSKYAWALERRAYRACKLLGELGSADTEDDRQKPEKAASDHDLAGAVREAASIETIAQRIINNSEPLDPTDARRLGHKLSSSARAIISYIGGAL